MTLKSVPRKLFTFSEYMQRIFHLIIQDIIFRITAPARSVYK